MHATRISKRKFMPGLAVGAALAILAASGWHVLGARQLMTSATPEAAGETTGSTTPAAQLGPSGLPVPRFVSLKTEKANVRKGPSSDHAVAWVYQSKGLPVEITAESETWRRVRDAEGAEGWVLQNMLSGKRTAQIAPSRKGTFVNLMAGPSVESGAVAKFASGVLADIKSCDGNWCRIVASGFDGYVNQNLIWGAYPGEVVN
jgi:SH3-like domain-containing protein